MNAQDLSSLYDGSESERVYSRSSKKWQSLSYRAQSLDLDGSVNLQPYLQRVPSLPFTIPSDALSLSGRSTWKNLDEDCQVRERQGTIKWVRLVKRHASKVTIIWGPNHFMTWPGSANNGIALLTLAWCYVLSASLADRKGLSMVYGQVSSSRVSAFSTTLRLHYATAEERRWWKAIVSQGTGWAIADKELSPWVVDVEGINIEVEDDGSESSDSTENHHTPPTAREAACYISRVCTAYRLGNQCSAALAASLCIPLQASLNIFAPAKIQLPETQLDDCSSDSEPCPQFPPSEFDLLDHLMTLSLCSTALGSTLWSAFWEPGIPCNHAGAWLVPIAVELHALYKGGFAEPLAKILSLTSAGPLWIGLAICGPRGVMGVIERFLTQFWSAGFTCPDMDAAAWTGVRTSFFDHSATGPCQDGTISREDVWRLRHDLASCYLDGAFSYTPSSGWAPFGSMKISDVELEIQGHLHCSHRWMYDCWTWIPCGTVDRGFLLDTLHSGLSTKGSMPDSQPLPELPLFAMPEAARPLVRELSEKATKDMFTWARSQVEKGFGGTIVPQCDYGRGNEPPTERQEKPIDKRRIQKWLEKVAEESEEGHARRRARTW